ncbi:MAG: helix-hairpin-helix domain-containing protein [Thermodesulfobacteriota bacterium]
MKNLILSCIFLLLWTGLALAGVNINTADPATLQTLKGIGPSKAQAIVDYREAHGQFTSAAEITKVKGIGEKTFVRIKDEIEVE